MVFNPLLFVSFNLYYYPVIETIEKTAFPCSGILFLCFKSVGLDITSVLLNPYKMAATYPFCDFLLSKNQINARFPRDTLWIERVFSIPTNFTFELKTWLNRILSIYILIYMIYLRSCSNLLIGINPRFLPPERWIHTFYPSSIMYYIHYNLTKRRIIVKTEQMSGQEHLHSYKRWRM